MGASGLKEREGKQMEQKYLLFLLGFEVALEDRRTGDTEEGFIIVPYPGEHPDDLADVHPAIKKHYDRLGYAVKEIKHQESKVVELDLQNEYTAAPTTAQYAEE